MGTMRTMDTMTTRHLWMLSSEERLRPERGA
jgi:hypothetical protein